MNASLQVAVAIGDEVERFGSYFGYAAIVGIGVLSLLYFAQAREVKRLREWAGRAPERDAELAQRVQADAQRRVVAQPIPAPSPAVAPGSPQTAAAQQADAARKAAAAAVVAKAQGAAAATPSPGVGPPGTPARTTPAGAPGAVPPAASPGPVQPPPGGVPAVATAAAATPAPGAGATSGAAAPEATTAGTDAPRSGTDAGAPQAAAGAPAAAAPPGGSAPGTSTSTAEPAAPAAPGPGGVPAGMSPATAGAVAAARRAAAPSRTTGPASANGTGQETHESDAARPAPYPDLPPRAPRKVANAPTGDGGPRSRVGAIVAGVGTLLVLAVVLVVVLSSGGSDPKPAGNEIGDASTPPAAAPPPARTPAKVDRANTPVAVLNGTTTTGLARGVADKLEKSGFTILSVGDNADQAIATTTISYSDGNERAARTVAQIMDVSSSAVKPIDANTSVAVAPEAKVVVIVGNDRSSTG